MAKETYRLALCLGGVGRHAWPMCVHLNVCARCVHVFCVCVRVCLYMRAYILTDMHVEREIYAYGEGASEGGREGGRKGRERGRERRRDMTASELVKFTNTTRVARIHSA